jgi:hypothetical protein
MLFHISIDADDPRHVAEVLAEFWGGEALPFPSVAAGSWVALSGDERGTMVEVYPRGTELHAVDGDHDAVGLQGMPHRYNPVHFAIGTGLDQAAVMAICEREGWPAKYRKRGGAFGVIEIFVEGCQMLEVLTPEMQSEYVRSITIPNWQRMIEGRKVLEAA